MPQFTYIPRAIKLTAAVFRHFIQIQGTMVKILLPVFFCGF